MSKARLSLSRSPTLAIVLTLTLLALLAIPSPVSAATLCVRPGGAGGCFASIQAAINAANANDVIHVYPGTYGGVVLNTMLTPGNISFYAVDSSGTPAPGTATVNGGASPAFDSVVTHPGDVTIDGFMVTSTGPPLIGAINVFATGDVVIQNVTANGTSVIGIVVGAGGDATVRNCSANNNSNPSTGHGIVVSGVDGNLTIENCTANNNAYSGIVAGALGTVSITGCIAQGNGVSGIQLVLPQNPSNPVKGNIICGNRLHGLSGSGSVDAEGNWWGCSGGPGSPGCDTVGWLFAPPVDFTPWISTFRADATPASGGAGQPVHISFRVSDSASTVFLAKGPGDLNGTPTFTVHTDNGTLADSDETGATVHEFIGSGNVLSVTLVPDATGTATVTADGPCELAATITVAVTEVVEEEFVPEPGSVILLAGGLMGLAGYATLRWRSRV